MRKLYQSKVVSCQTSSHFFFTLSLASCQFARGSSSDVARWLLRGVPYVDVGMHWEGWIILSNTAALSISPAMSNPVLNFDDCWTMHYQHCVKTMKQSSAVEFSCCLHCLLLWRPQRKPPLANCLPWQTCGSNKMQHKPYFRVSHIFRGRQFGNCQKRHRPSSQTAWRLECGIRVSLYL